MGHLVSAQQCLEKFGSPYAEKSMVLWDVPTELEIGVIPKRIYCNKLLVIPLSKALKNLIDSGCVEELKTWDGCFNIRKSKGSNVAYSLHAWGLAIDVNAAWNRYGKKPTLSKEFVECFTDAGFIWGGNWSVPDGMHFQLGSLVDNV